MSLDYRYEIKFVLDNARLSDAIQWIYSETNAYNRYENRLVNSIYFDDVDFSSVRDNLAGISRRNKYRMRWYGLHDNNNVFYEVKTKNGRLGYKTIIPIKSINRDLTNYSYDEISRLCAEEIMTNDFMVDMYLLPTLQVSYEREYFETHEGVRITIDQNINFSDVQLHDQFNDVNPIVYPYSVMEVKFIPDHKDLAQRLIRSLHMTPRRHSKYLIGLAMLGYVVYI
jgi:SPX domain protein involved in polyphosphate accumulation